jgi:hypothetical protein
MPHCQLFRQGIEGKQLTWRLTDMGAFDNSFKASFWKISTARSLFSFNAKILTGSSLSSTVKPLNIQVRCRKTA